MLKVDKKIIDTCKNISSNIDKLEDDIGLLSQNILSQLRNLIEAIISKIYIREKSLEDANVDYQTTITPGINYVKGIAKYRFLINFHNSVQISSSHYLEDENISERLMYKYIENLIKIKNFIKKEFKINVLSNLNKFPIDKKNDLHKYYQMIAKKIDMSKTITKDADYSDRYYVHKKKPFFVDGEIYYEITVVEAKDQYNKFDRFIFYTKIDINPYYAIKIKIQREKIKYAGLEIPIIIVNDYQVAIRPCEIENYHAVIFGIRCNINPNYIEYRILTNYLKEKNISLVDVIELDNYEFEQIINTIEEETRSTTIINILNKSREIIKANLKGSNILKLLLLNLNNVTIKNQSRYKNRLVRSNLNLSKLYLHNGCIPFEEMPYCSSPIGTNVPLKDLFKIIDFKERKHEFLARFLIKNAEKGKQIYTTDTELEKFGNLIELINAYNSQLHDSHIEREIERFGNKVFIKSYDINVSFILKKLISLTNNGVSHYTKFVNSWLSNTNYNIDCLDKRNALLEAFSHSKMFAVYGSAGTGKTKMLEHFAHLYEEKDKLFLSNTYASLENLKRRIKVENSEFSSIKKYLKRHIHKTCDILILDECSAISNEDMRNILEVSNFEILILAGDPFQIESIVFGNWFEILRNFIPKTSYIYLNNPYRTKNNELLTLWDKVRNFDSNIKEFLMKGNYCSPIDKEILEKSSDNEIVLCLNYDGLYGINNVNRLLQQKNTNQSYFIGINEYKIGDPILFNENCDRYEPILYNNTKGTIRNIEFQNGIHKFQIELDKTLDKTYFFDDGSSFSGISLIGETDQKNSIIEIILEKGISSDNDDAKSNIPFNVSYAVSIHKSQGLEYDSVKIIIVDEVEELITHNIFYTAITRAKEKLKIFWSPKTEEKILSSFEENKNKADAHIISAKHNLKILKK